MILVGITGLAGSGKDTVADRLVEAHGFQKMSMAKPLKDMLLKLNPILGLRFNQAVRLAEEIHKGEGHLKEQWPEYRRLLQVLGTDCIRAIDENFWVRAMVKELDRLPEEARVVIPDVRFPNEASMVQDYQSPNPGSDWVDGELWHIKRPSIVRPMSAEHSSEQWAGKMDEDIHIVNGGTVSQLHNEADQHTRSLLRFTGVIQEQCA